VVENDDVGGGEPYRILVVDDFEGFRRFVDSALRRRTGFQVVEASDGLGAVQKAE
jgi:CheY-like chemotaxis protein